MSRRAIFSGRFVVNTVTFHLHVVLNCIQHQKLDQSTAVCESYLLMSVEEVQQSPWPLMYVRQVINHSVGNKSVVVFAYVQLL